MNTTVSPRALPDLPLRKRQSAYGGRPGSPSSGAWNVLLFLRLPGAAGDGGLHPFLCGGGGGVSASGLPDGDGGRPVCRR